METLETRQLLAAVIWDAGGDGTSFSDPLNWSGDSVPGTNDDVTIDLSTGTPYSVRINTSEEIASLTIDSTDAAVRLDDGGLIVADDVAVVSGSLVQFRGDLAANQIIVDGLLQVTSTASIATSQLINRGDLLVRTSSTSSLTVDGSVRNSGTILLGSSGSGSSTLTVNGGSLLNEVGGQILFETGLRQRTLSADVENRGLIQVDHPLTQLNKANGVIDNFGEIVISAGSTINTLDSATVINQRLGKLDIQGDLRLTNGVLNLLNGTVEVGGSLRTDGGDLNISGGSVLNDGTLRMQGRGELSFTGGDVFGENPLIIAGTTDVAIQHDGVLHLSASSDINLRGTLFEEQSLVATRNVTVQDGFANRGDLELRSVSSTARLLRNDGDSTLVNEPTGTLRFTTDVGSNTINWFLNTPVENLGRVEIAGLVSDQKANTFINRGEFVVDASGRYTRSTSGSGQSSFVQSDGVLTNLGRIDGGGLKLDYLGGEIIGEIKPNVLLIGADAGNTGTFEPTSELIGNILAGQTVRIRQDAVSAPADMTNAGHLILEEAVTGDQRSELDLKGNRLSNLANGRVTIGGGPGEISILRGLVENDGRIEVTQHRASIVSLINRGDIDIASDSTLSIFQNSFFRQESGTTRIDGQFVIGTDGLLDYQGGSFEGLPQIRDGELQMAAAVQPASILMFDGGRLLSGIAEGVTVTLSNRSGTAGSRNFGIVDSTVVDGTLQVGDQLSTGDQLILSGFDNQASELTIGDTGSVVIDGDLGTREIPLQVNNSGSLIGRVDTTIGFANALHANAGLIQLDSSSITFVGQGLVNGVEGELTGVGELDFDDGSQATTPTRFENRGIVSPGRSPGGMQINGDQVVLQPESRLVIELAGTTPASQHDQIAFLGDVALSGTLDIRLLDDFTPQAGDRFEILSFGSRSGGFNQILGTDLGNGLVLRVDDSDPLKTVLVAGQPAQDLEVSQINAPPTAISGEDVSISYTVLNRGDRTNQGQWQDSVYVSRDGTFDPTVDPLVGRVLHTGDIGFGESYSETLTATLPPLVPGNYRFIVVSDSLKVLGDASPDNNVASSASDTIVTVRTLSPGDSIDVFVSPGEQQMLRVVGPVNEELRIEAVGEVDASFELLQRGGGVPSLDQFDQRAVSQNGATPAISLVTVDGQAFLLIRSATNPASPIQISVELSPFEIRSIDTATGSNLGSTTVTALGTRFETGATVHLISDEGTTIDALETRVRSANELSSVFNLIGVAPGIYDVQVKQNGNISTLPNAFTVSEAATGELRTRVVAPAFVRSGRTVSGTVQIENIGNTDIQSRTLFLVVDGGQVRFPGNGEFGSNVLEISTHDGNSDTLSPHQRKSFEFEVRQTGTGDVIRYRVSTLPPDLVLDHQSVRPALQPDGIEPQEFSRIYQSYLQTIGTTADDFQAVLDLVSERLAAAGLVTNDAGLLRTAAIIEAHPDLGDPLSGSVTEIESLIATFSPSESLDTRFFEQHFQAVNLGDIQADVLAASRRIEAERLLLVLDQATGGGFPAALSSEERSQLVDSLVQLLPGLTLSEITDQSLVIANQFRFGNFIAVEPFLTLNEADQQAIRSILDRLNTLAPDSLPTLGTNASLTLQIGMAIELPSRTLQEVLDSVEQAPQQAIEDFIALAQANEVESILQSLDPEVRAAFGDTQTLQDAVIEAQQNGFSPQQVLAEFSGDTFTLFDLAVIDDEAFDRKVDEFINQVNEQIGNDFSEGLSEVQQVNLRRKLRDAIKRDDSLVRPETVAQAVGNQTGLTALTTVTNLLRADQLLLQAERIVANADLNVLENTSLDQLLITTGVQIGDLSAIPGLENTPQALATEIVSNLADGGIEAANQTLAESALLRQAAGFVSGTLGADESERLLNKLDARARAELIRQIAATFNSQNGPRDRDNLLEVLRFVDQDAAAVNADLGFSAENRRVEINTDEIFQKLLEDPEAQAVFAALDAEDQVELRLRVEEVIREQDFDEAERLGEFLTEQTVAEVQARIDKFRFERQLKRLGLDFDLLFRLSPVAIDEILQQLREALDAGDDELVGEIIRKVEREDRGDLRQEFESDAAGRLEQERLPRLRDVPGGDEFVDSLDAFERNVLAETTLVLPEESFEELIERIREEGFDAFVEGFDSTVIESRIVAELDELGLILNSSTGGEITSVGQLGTIAADEVRAQVREAAENPDASGRDLRSLFREEQDFAEVLELDAQDRSLGEYVDALFQIPGVQNFADNLPPDLQAQFFADLETGALIDLDPVRIADAITASPEIVVEQLGQTSSVPTSEDYERFLAESNLNAQSLSEAAVDELNQQVDDIEAAFDSSDASEFAANFVSREEFIDTILEGGLDAATAQLEESGRLREARRTFLLVLFSSNLDEVRINLSDRRRFELDALLQRSLTAQEFGATATGLGIPDDISRLAASGRLEPSLDFLAGRREAKDLLDRLSSDATDIFNALPQELQDEFVDRFGQQQADAFQAGQGTVGIERLLEERLQEMADFLGQEPAEIQASLEASRKQRQGQRRVEELRVDRRIVVDGFDAFVRSLNPSQLAALECFVLEFEDEIFDLRFEIRNRIQDAEAFRVFLDALDIQRQTEQVLDGLSPEAKENRGSLTSEQRAALVQRITEDLLQQRLLEEAGFSTPDSRGARIESAIIEEDSLLRQVSDPAIIAEINDLVRSQALFTFTEQVFDTQDALSDIPSQLSLTQLDRVQTLLQQNIGLGAAGDVARVQDILAKELSTLEQFMENVDAFLAEQTVALALSSVSPEVIETLSLIGQDRADVILSEAAREVSRDSDLLDANLAAVPSIDQAVAVIERLAADPFETSDQISRERLLERELSENPIFREAFEELTPEQEGFFKVFVLPGLIERTNPEDPEDLTLRVAPELLEQVLAVSLSAAITEDIAEDAIEDTFNSFPEGSEEAVTLSQLSQEDIDRAKRVLVLQNARNLSPVQLDSIESSLVPRLRQQARDFVGLGVQRILPEIAKAELALTAIDALIERLRPGFENDLRGISLALSDFEAELVEDRLECIREFLLDRASKGMSVEQIDALSFINGRSLRLDATEFKQSRDARRVVEAFETEFGPLSGDDTRVVESINDRIRRGVDADRLIESVQNGTIDVEGFSDEVQRRVNEKQSESEQVVESVEDEVTQRDSRQLSEDEAAALKQAVQSSKKPAQTIIGAIKAADDASLFAAIGRNVAGVGATALGVTVAQAASEVVGSRDPNDIIGPAGVGPERFLTGEESLGYTIRFENLETATASAQEVIITQVLDDDFDLSTFEIGSFGFRDRVFQVPVGLNQYQTRIDDRLDSNLLIDVSISLDQPTRTLTWSLISVDPETGDLPADPFAGFLPPDVNDGEGEGFVKYSIQAKPSLPTGTRLDALATIVFDLEAAIDTPAIFNTLDTSAPTVFIDPLAPISTSPLVTLSWSADDGIGSGVNQFDVWVSENGGEFVPLVSDLNETSLEFEGQDNHQYSFFVVATDRVGFSTSAIPVPLVTTTVDLNRSPRVSDDAFTVNEGSSISLDLLANDIDDDNDRLRVVSVQADNGETTIRLDGTILYTPNDGFQGTDTLTYSVTDGRSVSDTGTAVVTVNNVAPEPSITSDATLVNEGELVRFIGSAFDPGTSDVITFSWEVTSSGTVVSTETGPEFEFRPTDQGEFSIRLTLNDGESEAQSTTRLLQVLNASPTALIAALPESADEGELISASSIVSDAGIEDTVSRSWQVVSDGRIVASGQGPDFSFRPEDEGDYAVSLIVVDGDGGFSSVTENVVVNNVSPQAGDDFATVLEDNSVTIDLLQNDEDVPDDFLTISILQPPADGDLTINPDRTVSFDPAPDFFGQTQFVYQVDDGDGGIASAIVTIEVAPVDDASDDQFTTDENVSVEGDVSVNDAYLGEVTYGIKTDPENGTTVMQSSGTFTYTPNQGFSGTDSFTYVATDSNGAIETQTVRVMVQPQQVELSFLNLDSSHATLAAPSVDGTVLLTGSYSDGDLANHQLTVDWGDGTVEQITDGIDQVADTFAVSHSYTSGGIFSISVTISNQQGTEVSRETAAFVQGIGLIDGSIVVIGTAQRDRVDVFRRWEYDGSGAWWKPSNWFEVIEVRARSILESSKLVVSKSSVSNIQIFTRSGSDHIAVLPGVDRSVTVDSDSGDDYVRVLGGDATVFAGAGDDHVSTGRGADVVFGGSGDDRIWTGGGDDQLFGGDGNDQLYGGFGNDIVVGGTGDDRVHGDHGLDLLIGGLGADRINGGKGQDLLIGGRVRFEQDPDPLDRILREWTSGDDYATRVESIKLETIGDNSKDHLSGNQDRDWFFASIDDEVRRLRTNEILEIL